MSAQNKTKKLLRVDLPATLLEANNSNPNKMSDREFDLLVHNIETEGCTEPVYVAPVDQPNFVALHQLVEGDPDKLLAALVKADQKFRVVSGHHRWQACMFLQMDTVPCTINWSVDFDQEQQDLQLVRHNVIKGKLDAGKFLDLYKRYEAKHGKEMMAEMFGFAEQAELDALIKQTAASLPPDMKAKFQEAAAEIKTVDDLAKLLNRLFSTYGDSLPFGFMLIDFGGQDSIWLRLTNKTFKAMLLVGDQCRIENRTMDDVVGTLVQLIANGKADALLKEIVAQTPETVIPDGMKALPTVENLEKFNSIGA